MTDVIADPAALRRKADKREYLADQITGADAVTLLHMATEYRELADRIESGARAVPRQGSERRAD